MSALFRRFLVVVIAGVLGVPGALAAPAAAAVPRSGADLDVALDADGSLLLTGAHYDVSVTNNGPQALASATVTVQLDPRASGTVGQPPACALDTATARLTCSFGSLAAGATATRTTWVLFTLPEAPTDLHATATRTASTPPDPVAGNDSSSVSCWTSNDYPGFPPHPYRVFC